MNHPQYIEPALAELRQSMKILDSLKQFPNVKFTPSDQMPRMLDPNVLSVPWLHENMVQVGRAVAHLAVKTWTYDQGLTAQAKGHVLTHNYIHTARLVRKWRYTATWNGYAHEYLGWQVEYVGDSDAGYDVSKLEQHPMIAKLHGVAANNRHKPALFGDSKVMSWCAVPKYAVIAAALKGIPVLIETPNHFDWRAVATKGFQSELSVMSGEYFAMQAERQQIAYANFF